MSFLCLRIRTHTSGESKRGWWGRSSPLNSSRYLGFGGYFIINLLSPDCLYDFLFSVELLFTGYLGVRVYLIINLLSSARLRAFLFYVELASPGYLDFGFYLIINLLSPASRCAVLYYVELASPGYLGFWFFFVWGKSCLFIFTQNKWNRFRK